MADVKSKSEVFKLWETRLEQEGLGVIESESFNPLALKGYWATRGYFEIASSFNGSEQFESEQEKTVWMLHAGGASLKEIVQQVGGSISSASRLLRRLRTRFGLPERMTTHPKKPSAIDAEVVRLRSSGLKHREIADALGVSKRRVRNCLTRLGHFTKRLKADKI